MAVKKGKAKKWFSIIAPKHFGGKEIGRTTASEPQNLVNRKIKVSAVDLTGNIGKYYLKFSLKISKVEEDKAFTEFDGSECLRDYVSRMIVRRVSRIDTVQDLVTKDGKKLRVKGIGVVRGRIKSSIQRAIRNKINKLFKAEIENLTLEGFVKEILSDEIKNKILQGTRKIYSIRKFEIRKTEVL
jgi:small subunit ribosomal protein S3Ae